MLREILRILASDAGMNMEFGTTYVGKKLWLHYTAGILFSFKRFVWPIDSFFINTSIFPRVPEWKFNFLKLASYFSTLVEWRYIYIYIFLVALKMQVNKNQISLKKSTQNKMVLLQFNFLLRFFNVFNNLVTWKYGQTNYGCGSCTILIDIFWNDKNGSIVGKWKSSPFLVPPPGPWIKIKFRKFASYNNMIQTKTSILTNFSKSDHRVLLIDGHSFFKKK